MKYVLWCLILFAAFTSSAQIESGKKNKKPTKKETADTSLMLYVQMGFGHSFRKLEANNTAFGKEPGERANETGLAVKNMQLGVLSPISKWMKWDFGMNWISYGEKYRQVSGDTVFSYTNRYSSVGIPIRIQMEYGKNLRVFCSVGMQGQLLSKYRHVEVTDIQGEKTETIDKTEPTLNTVNIASCASLGLRFRFMNHMQVLLAGDYYLQMSNSYNKQGAYRHTPWIVSGRFGLVYQF